MVGNVASRKASRVLLAVIGSLMIPLMIFGVLYFQKAIEQIRIIDKELLGSKIGQLVYPVLLSETHEVSEETLNEVSKLEAGLGFGPDEGFRAHLNFSSRKVDANHDVEEEELRKLGAGHSHEESISGYIRDVSDKSGLILDSEATSFYLAYALMVQLPDLLLNFELLMGNNADGKIVGPSDIEAYANYQRILGRTDEGVEGLESSVTSAANYSPNPERFAELKEVVESVEEGFERVVEAAAPEAFAPTILPTSEEIAAITEGRKLFLQSKNFTINGFQHLDDLLRGRRSNLMWTMGGMIALALGAAAIGLAMAYRMVRNTLIQLDIVEEARNEAIRINDEIADLNKDLAANVSMLKSAQDEIVKKGKMEQLGQLTATVAHELRNPLGAVRTSAFLIQRKVQGKELGLDSQLERINNGIVRCDNIITQLLDYSRTKKVTATDVNLDDWLEQIITEEGKKLPAALQVECSLGLSNQPVPVDTARLGRAVINLLSNAVEALVSVNEKTTTQTVVDPKIWISSKVVGEYAVITVRDNGPGISPENMNRIREPLFTTKNFGTGLGIPAIEQIAEQHGGHLTVESVLGQGATFSIHLPLVSRVEIADVA